MGEAPMDEAREATILARWWQGERNWGDAVNPVLIERLSGRQVQSAGWNLSGRPVYSVVGSVLDNAAEPCLVIWGSGFMHREGQMAVAPSDVRAVRGPLTRRKLKDQGVDCPEVYGDPALLYAGLIDCRKKGGRVGIVPHFTDQSSRLLERLAPRLGLHVVNIRGDVDAVVHEIASCDWIASSSLHGIVIADSLGIPNVWVKLSGNVMGGNFKFHDYFGGVGRPLAEPLELLETTSLQQMQDRVFDGAISFDREQLLGACPFRA
jgi:pyruvyltransferase